MRRFFRVLTSSNARLRRVIASRTLRLLRSGRDQPVRGQPVFIVGCGHSGTTLLLAILNAHPNLYSIPFESSLAHRDQDDVDWFIRHFNHLAARAKKQRWVEKTPSHIREISFLLEHFPECRIVVMMRDGRDVACSLRDRTGDFRAGVLRWLNDNAAAETWFSHQRVHVLKYEGLIEDPEMELRRLMKFLGEGFSPGLLRHEESEFRFRHNVRIGLIRRLSGFRVDMPLQKRDGPEHQRYRSWQARQPIHDYRGTWKSAMSEDELTEFNSLAGDRLEAYGYDASAQLPQSE